MSEIVEHHQLRFEARVEGSRTDFEKFVQKTKSEICDRIDSAGILMKWAKGEEEAKRRIANEMRERRREEYVPRLTLGVQTKSMTSNRRIISKLVELGHDLRDARRASYAYSAIPNLFLTTRPLTPAGMSVQGHSSPKIPTLISTTVAFHNSLEAKTALG